MTVLLLDLGNTALKWTKIDTPEQSKTYVHQGMDFISDELQQEWLQLRPSKIVGCMVSSENLALSLTKLCNKYQIKWEWLHSEKVFRSSGFTLHNSYDNYHQLGSDRWYAALGAASLHPNRALLVIHMGTATTVDSVITEDGQMYFLGGRIIPGPTMMLQSLVSGTRCRPGGIGVVEEFPVNTANAITTGIVEAQLGVIKGAYEAMKKKGANPLILFAGGAAPLLAPYILKEFPLAILQHNLVLRGLALKARQLGD